MSRTDILQRPPSIRLQALSQHRTRSFSPHHDRIEDDFDQNTSPATTEDPYLVIWNGDNDLENPANWPSRRKWQATLNMSAMGFVSILLSSIAAPALQDISEDLNMDAVEGQMALSAYVLGLAFAPLILGPVSEIVGRVRVTHITNAWFLVWTVVTGVARNKAAMIAARYMSGMGASLVYAAGLRLRLSPQS